MALMRAELGSQLAHRQYGRGRCRLSGDHRCGELAYGQTLYLGVLELTEHLLQALEILQCCAVCCRVVQWSEDLQEVAQLFAALAKIVQRLGRGVRPDGSAALRDPAMRLPQALRGQLSRARLMAGIRRLGQQTERPPVLQRVAESGRTQCAHQPAELRTALREKISAEGLQISRTRRLQTGGHVRQADDVHVEIAGGGGQVTKPLEIATQLLGGGGLQHIPGQLQRGPRPSYADPEVVQELRIDVIDDPAEGSLDGEQEPVQDGYDSVAGRHGRGQLSRLWRIIAKCPSSSGQRSFVDRALNGGQSRHRDQSYRHPLGLILISTYGR